MQDVIQILGIAGVIGMLYKISRELGGVTTLLKVHDKRMDGQDRRLEKLEDA